MGAQRKLDGMRVRVGTNLPDPCPKWRRPRRIEHCAYVANHLDAPPREFVGAFAKARTKTRMRIFKAAGLDHVALSVISRASATTAMSTRAASAGVRSCSAPSAAASASSAATSAVSYAANAARTR